MPYFNTYTLYSDLEELLPLLLTQVGIRQSHEIWGDAVSTNFFRFQWGEAPEKCDKGQAIIYAYPSNNTHVIKNNCANQLDLRFVLGLTVADESLLTTTQDYWTKINSLLGPDATSWKYQDSITWKTETVTAPFSLADFGIVAAQSFGTDGYVRINGECSMYVFQKIFQFSMHYNSPRPHVIGRS